MRSSVFRFQEAMILLDLFAALLLLLPGGGRGSSWGEDTGRLNSLMQHVSSPQRVIVSVREAPRTVS